MTATLCPRFISHSSFGGTMLSSPRGASSGPAYERLQAVRDAGEWEAWLVFLFRAVAEVSGEATDTARRILALREEHRAVIAEHLGRAAGSGHQVLERLYRQPIMSVNEVRGITGTSYPAANDLVRRLVEQGILREITGQARHRRFRFEEYVRLFDEEAGRRGQRGRRGQWVVPT